LRVKKSTRFIPNFLVTHESCWKNKRERHAALFNHKLYLWGWRGRNWNNELIVMHIACPFYLNWRCTIMIIAFQRFFKKKIIAFQWYHFFSRNLYRQKVHKKPRADMHAFFHNNVIGHELWKWENSPLPLQIVR